MMGWPALTAFAAVVFAVLSVVGNPRRRNSLRAAAMASALICAGFLAGPPFDQIAGGIVLALLVCYAVLAFLRSG